MARRHLGGGDQKKLTEALVYLLAPQDTLIDGDVDHRPETVIAWQVFLQCKNQWKYAGMSGVITGIDVQSVWTVLDRHPAVPHDPDDSWTHFERIMHIETVYLQIDQIKRDGKDVVAKMNALISGERING